MKPAQKVVFGLLLTGVVLVPALPQLEAQYRCPCPYAVSVSHIQVQQQQTIYYQQMQQQQMMHQQMQYHYQQQQMMMQQQRQQVAMQQQRVIQQQQKIQTHVNQVQQNVGHVNFANYKVGWNQAAMHVPVGGGGVAMHVPRVNMAVGHVNQTVAHVNVGVNRLNTAVQTVSTRVNRVDTSTARVNTSVNRVDTSVKRVDTSVQQVNTQVNRVNTGSKTICTTKDMTVVTINYNCMACHKQMHAVAQQPVLPNPVGRQNVLQMPVPQRPVPQLPNLVAKQDAADAEPGGQATAADAESGEPNAPVPHARRGSACAATADARLSAAVQLFPVPVNQPQLVQMPVAPLPLWDLPVQMGTYPRPGLPMFVTRPSDLPKMTSSGSTSRKPTTEPSTLMAVAQKSARIVQGSRNAQNANRDDEINVGAATGTADAGHRPIVAGAR